MKKRLFALISISLIIILALAFASCSSSGDFNAGAEMMPPESNGDVNLGVDFDGTLENGNDETQRKIIKTADVYAETKNFDQAIKKVEELCTECGGYIQTSSNRGVSLGNEDGARYASYTLRIPSESFDTFNTELGNTLNITSSSSNVDEITSQYYDIQSRIEVLELQKESLQKLYDSYTDYNDVDSLFALQDKLFAVIEEIEAYKTQLRLYDEKVAYSTVNLYINEVIEYSQDETTPSFIEIMTEALASGWEVFVWIITAICAVILFLLPWIVLFGAATIVIAVILVIVLLIVRKVRMKRHNE